MRIVDDDDDEFAFLQTLCALVEYREERIVFGDLKFFPNALGDEEDP